MYSVTIVFQIMQKKITGKAECHFNTGLLDLASKWNQLHDSSPFI